MEPKFCPAKFDLFDPDLQEDPYSVLAEARHREPIFWSEAHGGYWALTRYEDIYAAAHDTATFVSKHGNTIPPMGNNTMIPLHMDPPEHLKYRTLAAAQFGPRAIATMEDDVRAVVTKLIDGFIERGECDFSEQFAEHLPGTIIARLVGAPEDDRPLFVKWSADLAHADADDPEAALAAAGALWAYLAELVNARRAEPRDDLTTHLLNAEVDGESLSDEELCNFLLVVVAAGTDTTTGFLENTLYHLATHPADRQRLIDEPERIPGFIEEMLRYDTSVPSLARTVTRDVEFRGVKFRAGDKVSLLWASGNRDTVEFPDADGFVIDREPNRHISFGSGIHRCLGSHLARLEVRIALEELLTRAPDVRIADPAKVRRRSGMIIRGVKPLPLAFTPGKRRSRTMPTLEERIQVLEDRESIREVIANYCRGVDQRDEALFLSIWTEDAGYLIGEPLGDHHGLAAIKDILHAIWEAFPETHHFTTNAVIEVDGDTARCTSDVDCTATDAAGRAMLIAATYYDDLVRQYGEWRIKQRKLTIYYMTPILEPWSLDPATKLNLAEA